MNAVVVAAPQHDRRKYLGGSDIAAVLGISPWKSAVDLWADKIKPPSDEPARKKKIFHRGKVWEAVVAEMLTLELQELGHRVQIVGYNQRFKDAEHGMFAAEIDFEVILNDETTVTNVELKTVHPFAMSEWGETDSDDLPIQYRAQAMWGLGVAPGNRQRCIMAALFGADELRAYIVERDEETLAGMRAQGLAFWNNHVLTGVPPEPQSAEDVQKIFPKESSLRPVMIAPPDIEDAVRQLRAVNARIGACKAEGELLEFRIKQAMRDAGTLLIDDEPAVTWLTRPWSRLDQSALKEAHPKIVKEFTRRGESRTFSLK